MPAEEAMEAAHLSETEHRERTSIVSCSDLTAGRLQERPHGLHEALKRSGCGTALEDL
jgi:hypothetical protein